MKITDEQSQAVRDALKANPILSNIEIAKQANVGRTYVDTVRLKLGLWTSRRVRFRDGKPEIYHVPRPASVTAEQCLESEDQLLNITDAMIRQLHSLASMPEGQEAYQLICDVLEITEKG